MTSASSGKCADVAGAATHDGAVVQQYQCHGGANQQWRLVPVSGDAFNIVAVHSGKCLDVAGAATHDYAPVHQWSCTPPGAANQQWRVVLAAQVVRDSAQLAPGQEHCTTTRVSYSAGDGWWSNVVFQGSATAAITGWTIWYDNVDGNDGFGNRKWVAGWANSISRIFNAQQVDRNDNTTGIKDYWFCAKNTTSWHIAADFHIANEIRQFTPPPPWTITPTGNHSWTVQGRLAPGERACAPGTAGRTGWIEAFIGLQLADVTLTNSATTKTVTTTIGAQFTIDSANPGLPDAIFGCVRNRDTVSLNFLFNFSAA